MGLIEGSTGRCLQRHQDGYFQCRRDYHPDDDRHEYPPWADAPAASPPTTSPESASTAEQELARLRAFAITCHREGLPVYATEDGRFETRGTPEPTP